MDKLAATAATGLSMMLASAAAAQTAPQTQPVTRSAYLSTVGNRFTQIDLNHDGQLTRAELTSQLARELDNAKAQITRQLAESFKRLDTNKDGQLSFQEFSAAAPQLKSTETPDQLLQSLDTNHDGKVSLDEFRAPQVAKFNRADTNHDGIVTPAEARAAAGQK